MLQVRQISTTELHLAMQGIASRIIADGLTPSYLLGILEGGRLPSECLAAALGAEIPLLFYRRQRATTGWLKTRVLSLIRKLPTCVLDHLRAIELSMYGALAKFRARTTGQNTPDRAIEEFIRSNLDPALVTEAKPLLIVDDAVDTGKTLMAVVCAVEQCGISRDRVRTAAVVQTLSAPLLRVDYVAYSDVILRFPWSSDYRGRDENRS